MLLVVLPGPAAAQTTEATIGEIDAYAEKARLAWNIPGRPRHPASAEFQIPDPQVTREMAIRELVSHGIGLVTFSVDLLWYQTRNPVDGILRPVRFLKPVNSFRPGDNAASPHDELDGKPPSWPTTASIRPARPTGIHRSSHVPLNDRELTRPTDREHFAGLV